MSTKYIYTSFINKMKRAEDFDTEKFIIEIQKRECIWNINSMSYNLKCYRNRETKKQAWEELGSIFTYNWDSLSAEEKQKRVDTLNKKWANLKKYYSDEVKKPAAEGPVKKRPRRRYHNLLKFLDDSIQKKRVHKNKEFKNLGPGDGNESSDSESNELCIVEDVKELEKLSKQYSNTDTNTVGAFECNAKRPLQYSVANIENNPSNVNSSQAANNPEIMKLLTDNSTKPLPFTVPLTGNCTRLHPFNVLMGFNKTSSLDLTADASKKFLLSLLPELMSLNVKQNMQFRLGILDLLNDIKLKANQNT